MLLIKVLPEELLSLSSKLNAASIEIENQKKTLTRAAARLDWEISRRPEIEGLINKASLAADRFSEESYRLSNYLNRVSNRFQEADSNIHYQLNESSAKMNLYLRETTLDTSATTRVSLMNSFTDHNSSLDIIGAFPSVSYPSLTWVKEVIS